MIWVHPESLLGLLVSAIVIIVTILSRRQTRRNLIAISKNSVEWQVRMFLKDISMAMFMILAVLAMLEPRSGNKPISGERTGLDIAVAFDVSRSMLTEDLSLNRLEMGVAALGQITRKLGNARFSLIPFKGDAVVQVPMTEDRVMLNLWMDRLGPGLFSSTGTSLEAALNAAYESFPDGTVRSRIIILITDGESLTGSIDKPVKHLIREGIIVHVIISGTVDGGPVPVGNGHFVTDGHGRMVVSRADFRAAERLAENTGGTVQDLSRIGATANLIDIIEKNQKTAESQKISFTGVYAYRLFLIPAVVMMLLYLLARIFPWRKK